MFNLVSQKILSTWTGTNHAFSIAIFWHAIPRGKPLLVQKAGWLIGLFQNDWWFSTRRHTQFLPLLSHIACCAFPTPQRLNNLSRTTNPNWTMHSITPPYWTTHGSLHWRCCCTGPTQR
jgi:hypothetical protein